MNLRKKTIIGVVTLLVSGFTFYGFYNQDDKNFEISKNLDIYYSLFRELNTFYVDDIKPTELVKKSIDEMLQSLDPYTNYIPESDIEDFRFMTTGEYAGVGALIGKHGDEIVISEPYENFPAQKSGLKAGDVLVEVAGKKAVGMNTEDVSNLLKGPANVAVEVKVKRYGEKKTLTFNVVREKISIDPVAYSGMIDDQTGYIRLSSFTKDCAEKVKSAMLKLKEENGAKKLVLDLRGNPGGLLIESVNLCNLFINKGNEVVSTKGKVAEWDKVYNTTLNPVDTIMPLVVLVNRSSASASEIVSGTLQDLDRAVVIGTRTFGKGLVQTTRDLSYNTKLKITTAKYYIPSGRCIQALDYTHRNADGSVGHIPDSLITEFKTKNGRKVFDGGGVSPDIKVDAEEISDLSVNLIMQQIIFDYATKFNFENPNIAAPEKFEISDQQFTDFVGYVKSAKFDYTSKTESLLKELEAAAKDEKYFDISQAEIIALQNKLKHNLDHDLNQYKEEICQLLIDEIVGRYYYQNGAIKASIKSDKSIINALEVLNNSTKYNSILASSSGK